MNYIVTEDVFFKMISGFYEFQFHKLPANIGNIETLNPIKENVSIFLTSLPIRAALDNVNESLHATTYPVISYYGAIPRVIPSVGDHIFVLSFRESANYNCNEDTIKTYHVKPSVDEFVVEFKFEYRIDDRFMTFEKFFRYVLKEMRKNKPTLSLCSNDVHPKHDVIYMKDPTFNLAKTKMMVRYFIESASVINKNKPKLHISIDINMLTEHGGEELFMLTYIIDPLQNDDDPINGMVELNVFRDEEDEIGFDPSYHEDDLTKTILNKELIDYLRQTCVDEVDNISKFFRGGFSNDLSYKTKYVGNELFGDESAGNQ